MTKMEVSGSKCDCFGQYNIIPCSFGVQKSLTAAFSWYLRIVFGLFLGFM